MANKDYASLTSTSIAPTGSMTKLRVEQIKSEDSFNSLAIDLAALRGQVKDIIGAADYKEDVSGYKVQLSELATHVDAETSADYLKVLNGLDVAEGITGSMGLKILGGLDVGSSAKVGSLSATAGAIVFHDADKVLADNSGLKFDGTDLIAPSMKVSDLVDTQVVFAAASGELSGSGFMTYSVGNKEVTINGSTFGQNVSITGNLTVNGTTTTVNSTTLTVDDKNIELGSVATPDETTANGGGITLKGAYDHTITWDAVGAVAWVFNDAIKAASGSFVNLASKLVKSDAAGKLVDAAAMDFITGSANQVNLTAGSLAGSVVLSLPQSIHTDADVEFDSLKLGDLSDNRLLKTDPSTKLLVSADIMDFVTGTVNQVVATAGAFGNVVLSLPQDIHTGASPQFAALNVGTAHDIMDVGGDLYIKSTGGLVLSGADGQYAVSEAGDSALFATNFGASETIVGALNVLKAAATTASAAKSVVELGSAVTAGDSVAGISIAGFTSDNGMVFVNGQLMLSGSAGAKDYSIDSGALKFSFNLESGDVVVAQRA